MMITVRDDLGPLSYVTIKDCIYLACCHNKMMITRGKIAGSSIFSHYTVGAHQFELNFHYCNKMLNENAFDCCLLGLLYVQVPGSSAGSSEGEEDGSMK